MNLIGGELGGFRRGNHIAAMFHNTNEDARMAVHGDDFVCLSDDDGLKHIDSLLKPNTQQKTWEHLDSDIPCAQHRNTLFLFNDCAQIGSEVIWSEARSAAD